MFPAFCLHKILLSHKRNFFLPSESAHTFSFDVLLSFAMLLLLTISAPLQCLAAQKIWKCLDKLHPFISMRISSTESLKGHCCTQILYRRLSGRTSYLGARLKNVVSHRAVQERCISPRGRRTTYLLRG